MREPRTSIDDPETRHLAHDHRPDIVVSTTTAVYDVDVSVVHSTSPSYLETSKTPAGLIEKREADKKRVYKEQEEKTGNRVVPFVVDSFGRWGKEALSFLHTVAAEYFGTKEEQAAFYRRSFRALAISLQRGNANILRGGGAQVIRESDRLRRRPDRPAHPSHAAPSPTASGATAAAATSAIGTTPAVP